MKTKRKTTNTTPLIVSAMELANWLGVTADHITYLAARGIVKRESHGKYRLKESVQVYCLHRNGRGDSASRIRADSAKAELAELELAQKRGMLVPVADAVALFADFITVARSRLLMLEAKVPAAARAETKELIHETLTELSRHDQSELIAQLVASHNSGMDADSTCDVEKGIKADS